MDLENFTKNGKEITLKNEDLIQAIYGVGIYRLLNAERIVHFSKIQKERICQREGILFKEEN